MKPRNFVHILAVALALSGYSAWSLAARQEGGRGELPADFPVATYPLFQVPLLRLDDARALWRRDTTLFLDVRAPFDYQCGHIAGAVNLPEAEIDKRFPALKDRLERAEAVVLYCSSPDCAKSYWSALWLHNKGLKRLHIYPAGWNEWINRGLPSAHSD